MGGKVSVMIPQFLGDVTLQFGRVIAHLKLPLIKNQVSPQLAVIDSGLNVDLKKVTG